MITPPPASSPDWFACGLLALMFGGGLLIAANLMAHALRYFGLLS